MSHNRIHWVGMASATLVAAGSYVLHQTVSEYGWTGTLNYVWLGDPYYGSPLGRYLHILKEVEKSLEKEETRINSLEESLERARLDSVDDIPTTKEIVKIWVEN